MMLRAYAFLFFCACLEFTLLSTSASAQQTRPDAGACQNPDIRIDVRPNEAGPPTIVNVGFRLIDLTEIDDVKQTLTGDYVVRLDWTDGSLSHLEGCEIPLDRVWSPSIIFLNSGRLITSRPREVNIGPDDQVVYLQRYYGALASYHKLHDFPFDEQKFAVTLLPVDLAEKEVQLVNNEEFTGRRERLNISDWSIVAVKGQTNRQKADIFDGFHSRFDFEITAHRHADYFIWKVILPLALIVAMSWSVFWIAPTSLDAQIALSSTSFLTLIAFIFATTNMVPKLVYFTRLDWFILGSTVFIFPALLESIATEYLVVKNREDMSLRIDEICRIAFPAAFLIFSLYVLIA